MAPETLDTRDLDYRNAEGDVAAERLERRWFAAFKAASAARARCEELLSEMERVESDWNEARVRLAELEELRDVLGEEMSGLELADHKTLLSLPHDREVNAA